MVLIVVLLFQILRSHNFLVPIFTDQLFDSRIMRHKKERRVLTGKFSGMGFHVSLLPWAVFLLRIAILIRYALKTQKRL